MTCYSGHFLVSRPDYDLILFDTPPGDVMILDAVLACCQGVVIPTRADEGSLDGLTRIAKRFKRARRVNPDLRLAGVVLFGIGSRSFSTSKTRFETLSTKSSGNLLPSSTPTFGTSRRPALTCADTASSPTSSKLKLLPRRRVDSRHSERELSLKKISWRAMQLGSPRTTKSSRWKSSAN